MSEIKTWKERLQNPIYGYPEEMQCREDEVDELRTRIYQLEQELAAALASQAQQTTIRKAKPMSDTDRELLKNEFYFANDGKERDWSEQESQAQQDDTCPECGRKKAKSADDCAAGLCPKWYAIRDKEAAKDCQNVSQAQQLTEVNDVGLLSGAFDLLQEASKELERLNIEVGISRQPLVDELSGIGYVLRDFLQSQEQQSQWISVEERLPEKSAEFLALIFYKQRPHDKLIRVVRSLESDDMKVTHWMPIPPAPEGGEKSSCRQCGAPSGNIHCLGDILNCSDLAAPEGEKP